MRLRMRRNIQLSFVAGDGDDDWQLLVLRAREDGP